MGSSWGLSTRNKGFIPPLSSLPLLSHAHAAKFKTIFAHTFFHVTFILLLLFFERQREPESDPISWVILQAPNPLLPHPAAGARASRWELSSNPHVDSRNPVPGAITAASLGLSWLEAAVRGQSQEPSPDTWMWGVGISVAGVTSHSHTLS